MAITKTTELNSIEVHPNTLSEPAATETVICVQVRSTVVLDDPDDDTLPIHQSKIVSFYPGDDVTGQPQLVQDICAAVWTD